MRKNVNLSRIAIFSVFVMLAVTAITATSECSDAGQSGTTGSLSWSLDDEGTLTITGKGNMTSSKPWLDYSDSIFDVIIGDQITSISSGAFKDCTNLENVFIGSSVKIIGGGSYSQNGAFSGCTSLSSVNIPDSVEEIHGYAFYGCKSLTAISLGQNCVSINAHAFFECSRLASIDLKNVQTIGNSAFYSSGLKTVDVPDSVTSLGTEAFYGCTSLVSAAIGDSLRAVPDSVFRNCTALESVEIGNSVKTIGGGSYSQNGAFSGCTSLSSVNIPDSVEEIHGYAFYGCKSLTAISLGQNAVSIERSAFENCNRLASIDLENVQTIGINAFYSSGLRTVDIPDSVISLGNNAFYGCTSLASVTIGDSLRTIPDSVFRNCTALESVEIGNSVKTIGGGSYSQNGAFSGCTSLSSVNIPDSVEEIYGYAFYNCKSIIAIKFGTGLVEVKNTAFDGISFYNGTENIAVNAANLIGKTFFGSNAKLYLSSNVPIDTTFTIGNVIYTITSTSPQRAKIIGFVPEVKDVTIPKVVSYMGYTVSVTAVDAEAFYGCTTLTSINLGNVTSIETKAFANCTALKTVTMSKATSVSGYAFYGCKSISKLNLPAVKTIGTKAFYGCTGLTSASFSQNLNTVGTGAFGSTQFFIDGQLVDATTENLLSKKFTGTGGKLYYETPIVVGSVFTVNGINYTVSSVSPATADVTGCSADITSAVIPGSVTYADKAFTVSSVGQKAFYGCTTLTSVEIDVSTVESKAFANCSALKTANLSYVNSVASYAFYGCAALESVTFSDSLSSVGSNAFNKIQFFVDGTEVSATAENLTGKTFAGANGKLSYTTPIDVGTKFTVDKVKYTITSMNPKSVNATGFETGITTVTVPSSVSCFDMTFTVSSVAEKAFYGCTTLTAIEIDAPVAGVKSFANCSALKTVDLSAVNSIDGYAFYGCGSLESITFSDDLNTVKASSFGGIQFFVGEDQVSVSAGNLAGKAFIGSNGKLYAKSSIPVGTEVSVGSITYTVTSSEPLEVAVTGYAAGIRSLYVPASIDIDGAEAAVTSIADQAFYNCKTLTVADLGEVTAVGFKAFANCTALKAVWTFSVKDFGAYAFYGCKSLRVLDLLEVETIGSYAFTGCTGLTHAFFSDGPASAPTRSRRCPSRTMARPSPPLPRTSAGTRSPELLETSNSQPEHKPGALPPFSFMKTA